MSISDILPLYLWVRENLGVITLSETYTNVAGTVALSGYYGFEIYLKYIWNIVESSVKSAITIEYVIKRIPKGQ